MTAKIHVEILPRVLRDDWIVVSAKVTGHPRRRKRNGTLFFEVPAELNDWLIIQDKADDLHDALLRALIFSAMEGGADITIHGKVSLSLLENLERFQEIFSSWRPQYEHVKMKADEEVTAPVTSSARDPSEAILTFSGGLDSTYSLYVHQNGMVGRNSRRIPHCLFVHGFDIRLRDHAFEIAFQRAERIARSLASRLIPIRTNLKEMLPYWPHSNPAALAAVQSLFERRYATGLISPSLAYDNPYLCVGGTGSTPWSDPLFSSDTFKVVHDEASKTRVEKSEILHDCEAARKDLRVCWAGDDMSANCGTCSKCIRQMLCIKAVGLEDYRAFKTKLRTENILATEVETASLLEEWKKYYAHARRNRLESSSEFVAMKQVIDRAERSFAAVPYGSREQAVRKRPAASRAMRFVNRIFHTA